MLKFCNMFKDRILEHQQVVSSLINDDVFIGELRRTASIITDVFKAGGKLLLCGNGGSAADSQHIATELVSRFYLERAALDAEALTINTSSLTAIANDYSFDDIFSRQVEAKGRKGDVIIGISTSGNSKNVYNALVKARSIGMVTISFIGGNLQTLIPKVSDIVLSIPSKDTPRIQECHIMIGHILCEYIESNVFK
ncbi:MAG: D-sedoheptulose 7-phosphate isomerase [Nitrospirae bacterium]|nr:D-sedoheptulose 7-phosphate isomerase [Nitrospirota bacterium]